METYILRRQFSVRFVNCIIIYFIVVSDEGSKK